MTFLSGSQTIIYVIFVIHICHKYMYECAINKSEWEHWFGGRERNVPAASGKSPSTYWYTIHPAFSENLKTISVRSSTMLWHWLQKAALYSTQPRGLLQQLLSILVKRMIYGCVAITLRRSHYHIDRPPDGLSSLITSWPVDKYLFETPMGGVMLDGSAAHREDAIS